MIDSYKRWLLACLLITGFFLTWYHVLPATDLPQHLGISTLAWRLLQHDAAAAQLYDLNFQWTPYYLAYFVLVPCVGLFGPLWGAKITLALVAGLWLVALYLCLRQLRAPASLMAFGVFTYFNMLFYWGFIVMLVGIPFVMLSVWGQLAYLESRAPRHLRWAAAMAFVATLAHGILCLPVAVCAAALALVDWRRNVKPAAFVLGVGMAPMLGVLVEMATSPKVSHPGSVFIAHTSPTLWLGYLMAHVGPLDGSLGSYGHGLALAIIVLAAATFVWRVRQKNGHPQAAPAQRYLLLALVGVTLIFLAFPRRIEAPPTTIWNVAPRFLILVELLFCTWLGTLMPQRAPKWLAGLMAVTLAMFSWTQAQLWSDFNTRAAPTLALLEKIPASGRAQVFINSRYVGALPPVLDHLAMYHVANGGLYASDMFADPHLPIHPHCPNEVPDGCRVVPNYVLIQKDATLRARLHLPAEYVLVGESPEFILFGSQNQALPLLSHLQTTPH